MSFAAMAAWQAGLVIGLAVAAGVFLFLLKLRPPQIIVPSLTLWHRVLDDARERTLWERIRRAVSLAIVVLITLALALAILRPQRIAPANVIGPSDRRIIGASGGGQVAIVIDSSWSMLAQTTNGHTRWDRAVARARALASGAGGEDIALSTTADGLVEGPTADVALIEAALDRIAPSGGENSPWPAVQSAGATYFLTDGAVTRSLPGGVVIESVFEPAANVAITAFDVRPGSSLDVAGQAFLEVANYATKAQDVRITLTRGSATVLDTHVELAAGAALQRMVPLDRGGDSRLRAHVSARENALVVDDEAVAWIPGAHPIAVTVVSDDGSVLLNFLKHDPGVKATLVSPRAYKPPAGPAGPAGSEDIVIFDRVVPGAAPTRPALFIAPPAAAWLGTPGSPEREPDWEMGGDHPILQGIDVLTMALERARPYTGAGLEPIAVSAKKTPLILVADAPDRRLVVLTFSVSESKLMFAPGYPVLMANIVSWLTQPGPAGTRRPGPIVFSGGIASMVGPDGQAVPVAKIEGTSVATLTRVGFYEASAGGATSVIAVNAGGPEVSDLRTARLPGAASTSASTTASRGRPWWLVAVALGLVLIAAEWWTWQRRVTV